MCVVADALICALVASSTSAVWKTIVIVLPRVIRVRYYAVVYSVL